MSIATETYTITSCIVNRRRHYRIGSLLEDNESRHVEYKMGGYAISNLEQVKTPGVAIEMTKVII